MTDELNNLMFELLDMLCEECEESEDVNDVFTDLRCEFVERHFCDRTNIRKTLCACAVCSADRNETAMYQNADSELDLMRTGG
jgi:hypothetical protein